MEWDQKAIEQLRGRGLIKTANFIVGEVCSHFEEAANVHLGLATDPEIEDRFRFAIGIRTSLNPQDILKKEKKLKSCLRQSFVKDNLEQFVFTYDLSRKID